MYLASDHIHPTPNRGRCRVRIFLPDEERDAPVVVCTELANNPGQSVTNAAERLAGEVISSFKLPIPLVWVEHHENGARGAAEDPETFDLVVFGHYEPRKTLTADGWGCKIGPPAWKPLDRESVERLVGRKSPDVAA